MLLTISVVSHGQAFLIRSLLEDLQNLAFQNMELIVTINIPEDESPFKQLTLPIKFIRNNHPNGFGANHNAAFEKSCGRYFFVVNPDVRIPVLDLNLLLSGMSHPRVGSVAPAVMSSSGATEDSARRFPTLGRLVQRFLLRPKTPDYKYLDQSFEVDWTAGMFVVFRREAFESVNGFDHSRFFMYYEDVDICRRLWGKGWSVMLEPRVAVIHDAQRASHRNFRHLWWHATSAFRYLSGL